MDLFQRVVETVFMNFQLNILTKLYKVLMKYPPGIMLYLPAIGSLCSSVVLTRRGH